MKPYKFLTLGLLIFAGACLIYGVLHMAMGKDIPWVVVLLGVASLAAFFKIEEQNRIVEPKNNEQ